ncbi:MAG: hypothetical protein ACKPKO_58445, partial [Candidatus Fonsibacter sp.]
MPNIKESHITSQDFIELHGSGIKAASTRDIVPYILSLQQRALANIPSRKHHHMLKIIECLHGTYQIMYSGGMLLRPDEGMALGKELTTMGQHDQVLQNQEIAAGK